MTKWKVGDKALTNSYEIILKFIGDTYAIGNVDDCELSVLVNSLKPIKTPAEIERDRVANKLTQEIITFFGYPKGAKSYRPLAEHLASKGWTDND